VTPPLIDLHAVDPGLGRFKMQSLRGGFCNRFPILQEPNLRLWARGSAHLEDHFLPSDPGGIAHEKGVCMDHSEELKSLRLAVAIVREVSVTLPQRFENHPLVLFESSTQRLASDDVRANCPKQSRVGWEG